MSLLTAIVKNSLTRLLPKPYIYGQTYNLSDVSFVHRENDMDSNNFEFTSDNIKV